MAAAVKTVSALATTDTDTILISKPSGTVDGDIMIAHIVSYNGSTPTCSGWTTIRTSDATDTTNGSLSMRTLFKVASSEGSTYSFTGLVGGITTALGRITRIDGQTSSNPIATSSANVTNSPSNTATGATVTPVNSQSLVLFMIGISDNGGSSSSYAIVTSNPTWTELYDDTNVHSIAMAYANRDEVTATGSATASLSTSEKSAVHMVVISGNTTVAVPVMVATSTYPTPTTSLSQTVAVPVMVANGSIPNLSASQVDNNVVNLNKTSSSWINKAKS